MSTTAVEARVQAANLECIRHSRIALSEANVVYPIAHKA